MKLSTLIPNADNPRTIKDTKFKELVENLRKFPKFLTLRPIVVKSREDKTIIGGNMRFEGLKHLGYTEIPEEWVKTADDFTEDEWKAFIVLDNVPFGEWDFDALANHYDYDELQNLGLDIPDFSALGDINADDFFQKQDIEETIATKVNIILEFPPEIGEKVRAALAERAATPELAVLQLLGLD